MTMPESPRFLLLQGNHVKAREVLIRMYVTNTKENPENFPVKLLEPSEEAKYYFFHQTDDETRWKVFKNRISGMWQQHKQLFRKGDLYKILLTCYIDFGLMFRGTALSLTVTVGRFGAVLGNIIFGTLIDKMCVVPFALFTFFLICYGRFQYKLMALCGFIYSCCSLSTTTLSFVLPAAEQDFKLNSATKGLLNTAPLIGMVLGSYFWGNFADSKGRRFVLIYALLMDAIAAFVSSLCQHYWIFFICRIFNGFGIIGATSMVFAYLGEFIEPRKRDHALARLELWWTAGILALPGIGLAVLPHTWQVSNDWFTFSEWKLFVFVCGIPSLLCALVMIRMPESPRFLLLQGKHHKAKEVLVRMYVANTKEHAENFPVKVLEESEEAKYYFFHQTDNESKWAILKHRISGIWQQHKQLFRKGDLHKILLTCYIDFGLMSSYYTIILWIPELMERQQHFQTEHPGQSATLCEVSKEVSHYVSKGGIDIDVFIHTIIICVSCIPSTIILLYVMQYISKNLILIFILLVSGLAALALYFVNTTNQVIAMCCVFEAFATLVEAVLFCVIVEIFPTNTRGTALSLTVTVGRFGAVLGNIIFGMLIDKMCVVPFALFTFFLITSGIMASFLPKTKIGH